MQEYILLQTLACENIDVVFLRFQNVYGPGQSLQNPYTGVLSIFASQLQSGKILDIFEDGEIVRDFVYINDVADAIMAAAFVERAPQAPINIGSGKPSTILQVARIMLKLFDLPCDRLMITGKFRSGDIRHAVADISRANSELGWHPRVSLETGLTRLVEWVRSGQLT
jgi:dTDP-L-rhamnose 4-epimerase